MAIKISGTTVVDDSRGLTNIATIDATTAAAITAAGVGGSGGGNFNTAIINAVGYAVTDSMATAFTAPSTAGKRYVIYSIHVTNIDGVADADISGQMYGSYSFAYTVPVPAGSAVELLKKPKVLSPNETIDLQASVVGDLHATIAYEIIDGTDHFGSGVDITGSETYQDLHTATADSVLESVLLSNDDGTLDLKATVVWTDGSDSIQGYYCYDLVVPADATVEVLETPKALPSGYKIRVKANVANRLEAIIAGKAS